MRRQHLQHFVPHRNTPEPKDADATRSSNPISVPQPCQSLAGPHRRQTAQIHQKRAIKFTLDN